MREKQCNQERLKEYIGNTKDFILEGWKDIFERKEDIKNNVSRYPVPNEQIISSIYSRMFNYHLENIEARYSLGEAVGSIIDDYEKAIVCLNETNEEKGYFRLLWMTSIGIMLETSQDNFEILYESVKKSHYENDYLLQYLFSAVGIIEKVESSYLFKKNPYSLMKEIIEAAVLSKDKASLMLQKYVEKEWLDGHKDYEWHKFHKKKKYLGRWSFEAGAIAKMLGLEDEKIKECNHYPYDLRHYRNDMQFHEVKVEAEEAAEAEKAEGKYSPIIPDRYYAELTEMIEAYKKLSDEEFYQKYEKDIKELWFTLDMYKSEKERRNLEGLLAVNYLVDKEVILQLDYKEDLEDYIDTIENPWKSKEVKLVDFDLESDQYYYMYVLKDAPDTFYGVKMKEVKR